MFSKKIPFNRYIQTTSYLNLKVALFLLCLAISIGVVGFMIIEGYTLNEAFYMTIITISTVGFQEAQPLSPLGRWFVSFLILINICVFAYAISAFTTYIIEGEIFKSMHMNEIQNKIEKLQGHTIVCGFGRYGSNTAEHFIKQNTNFVIIESKHNIIEDIDKQIKDILFVEGDATDDDVLLKAGIKKAKAIVCALDDDGSNILIALSARQLNPSINIISRVTFPKNVKKLKRAGADHIIMPEQIGGFYMAALVNKPGAVDFFSFLTSEYESDIDFDAIHYEDLPPSCQGKSIRDLAIKSKTGANVIAFRDEKGHYTLNPKPDTILTPRTRFIIIGSDEQLIQLREHFKNF